MSAIEALKRAAQELAVATPDFFKIKGAGAGDRATNTFMRQLRERVCERIPGAKSEQRICGKNNLAVDFYLPADRAIVEVALSLRNPGTEFERDILKALMAQDAGHDIKRLCFISKPGALKRHWQASSRAIVQWAKRIHHLEIEIYELEERAT